MNLKLQSIADKGDLTKERLVIKVLKNTDIADYVILRTGCGTNGVPTTKVHNTLWLASKKLAAGDLVVIYSKAGANSEKELSGERTAHFIYWGSTTALWGAKDKVAVLLHAPEWESKTVEEL
ncbi:hypothetical protein AB4Z35_09230 [Pseudomonas sp. KB_15]|uniref:hypothetical protein n=1 Tax=Pseudomonas sp. KB_15 TaxID=3233035 RepID=UPI003F97C054